MSKFLRNIFSVLMAVIVLITSNGIVLASHTCLKKADTKVSLFQNKSCCSKSNKSCESADTKSVKSNCCISSVSYHKVSVNSLPSGKKAIDSKLLLTPVSVIASAQPVSVFIPSMSVKPPLLFHGGKDLLIHVSTFRI
jgi:hypothetical protein